ncbi:MAG TPA: carboxylesterase/lipase family protein [Bryobacteraceae bacterium]|nr:carboxylesterase/lipase family protein [Bryobacteraceae bacterium]
MTHKLNRRSFVSSAALGASTLLSGAIPALAAGAKDSSSQGPVANTTAGKIRGTMQDRVHAFRGIPYGAPTGGANRFLPPQKPEAWTGVKDTMEWGPEAPQGPHTEIPEVAATIPKTGMSEDCLRLNVWTNALDSRKRPVMVWLHGGGFSSGNGSYTMYDGANMARRHDVVTVTVNHRLNSFGFLYLAEIGGAKFSNASNAGILDVVAALEWVRDNIANFGGDPKNVTIFGQSGGAGKVSTLLAMPSAKGLFHRAIIQSGSNLKGVSTADATKSAHTLMDKLGVKTAEELQQVPMDKLISATLGTPGLAFRFAPVVDGKTLPNGPFDPTAPELAAEVPVLIGTTEFEVNFFPNTKLDPINDTELHAAVKQATRADDAQVDKLLAVYRKGRPNASDIDLSQIVASDNFRTAVVTEAERKAAQPAPVYMYYFTWKTPVHDGKLKAFHTLEIPFVLDNVDEAKSMTGSGADRYPLQDKMSSAWAAFARTGNPNHRGLPNWPKFTTDKRATMVFDNTCKVVDDPHGAERQALAALRSGARA